jgi:hypothetical protein
MYRYNTRQGYEVSVFSTSFRPALGSTRAPIQCIAGLFPEDEVAGAWSLPLNPARAEVKNGGTDFTPSHVFIALCLILS